MAKNQTEQYEDERVVRDKATEQVSRDDASRASRSQTADGDRNGREIFDMTAQERLRFLRDEFTTQTLPSIPPIPGYHVCWLSTTNQYDSIMRRMRLGYRPVRTTELPPGFSSLSIKTGEHEGCIAVNEMILFKIPEDVYQELMKVFHHDLPNDEAEKLRSMIEMMKSGDLSKAGPLIKEVGDGTDELLRRERKNPVFAS